MSKKNDDGMLERNVSTLLEAGGETPRMADEARARIRAALVAKHGTLPARTALRSPVFAIGLGLAATAAGALIVTRVTGEDAPAVREPDGTEGATWIAHAEDHHPDLEAGYNHCRVTFSTHTVGGLSENDFVCAAKIDAL